MAATCMESKKDKDILACVCVRHVLNGIVLHPQLQPELHLQKHFMNSFWTFRLMCLFLTEKKTQKLPRRNLGGRSPSICRPVEITKLPDCQIMIKVMNICSAGPECDQDYEHRRNPVLQGIEALQTMDVSDDKEEFIQC